VRQRNAVSAELTRRLSGRVEQQHVPALREGKILAIGTPREAGRPARRARQHMRRLLRICRLPQQYGAVLAGAGQRCAARLPSQLQHTRRMAAQRSDGAFRR